MDDNRARRNYDRDRIYDYDEFVRRSTRGQVSKTPPRQRSVSREKYERLREQYNKKLKKCLFAGALAGAILFSGIGWIATDAIPNLINTTQVNQEIYDDISGFRSEYISPNTHRTNDNQHYFYDYYNIYEGLNEYGDGDFDLNLYYCLQSLDSKNTSEVLDCSDQYRYMVTVGTTPDGETIKETRSLRNYLYLNGFYEEGQDMLDDDAYEDALKNYRSYMKERMHILDKIDDTQSENVKKSNELTEDLFVLDEQYNIYNSKGGK